MTKLTDADVKVVVEQIDRIAERRGYRKAIVALRARIQERYDWTESQPYSRMTGDEVREKDSDMALLREILEDIDEAAAAYPEVNTEP